MRKQRSLFELRPNPEDADLTIPGRGAARITRRGFLNGGLTAVAMTLGGRIPYSRHIRSGMVPEVLAQENRTALIERREGLDGLDEKDLVVLNERPLGAEARPRDLDDSVTPTRYHYVRNNGNLSAMARQMDSTGYRLVIDGEVERRLELSLDDLKADFPTHSWNLQLECGGNGRAGFEPSPSGMQWTVGAVACARWTGVSLADVLNAAGVGPTAIYTAHHSDDVHLSGNPELETISRGIPISKALNPYNLLAWEMNGAPLPPVHGFPLRLIIPGWPGSASAKWLSRISLRDRIHDGRGMTGYSYRINRNPVRPGTDVAEEDMDIIQSMPVKSVITRPDSGVELPLGQGLRVRGHAWAGDREVNRVDLSHDFGQTWHEARLEAPANPYAWQHWQIELRLPIRGYYEIWARATDTNGRSQPTVVPGWNPRGYLNNAVHRVAVEIV